MFSRASISCAVALFVLGCYRFSLFGKDSEADYWKQKDHERSVHLSRVKDLLTERIHEASLMHPEACDCFNNMATDKDKMSVFANVLNWDSLSQDDWAVKKMFVQLVGLQCGRLVLFAT